MEEIVAGVMADTPPEAPVAAPADAPVVAAEQPASAEATPIDVTRLPDFNDPDATEAWITAATNATNAQAAEETAAEAVVPPTTAEVGRAAAAPPSAPATPAEPDDAAILADLQARGFKIEPPAPPPDPYALLTAELAPHVGTPEVYAETQAKALTVVPPMPADTDPDWQDKYEAREAVIRERNDAAAQLGQMNQARRIAETSRAWARQRVLGDLGRQLEAVPTTYGLTGEVAARVTQPASLEDAVSAVAESVRAATEATWQAKYDARERYWEGKVAQAGSDRTAENAQRMGRAPQPGAAHGARPAGPGPVWGPTPNGLPTEEWIQQAISGRLANVDLS